MSSQRAQRRCGEFLLPIRMLHSCGQRPVREKQKNEKEEGIGIKVQKAIVEDRHHAKRHQKHKHRKACTINPYRIGNYRKQDKRRHQTHHAEDAEPHAMWRDDIIVPKITKSDSENRVLLKNLPGSFPLIFATDISGTNTSVLIVEQEQIG